MINFRTYQDLNLAIVNRLVDIKKLNVDLVVGIPKSGMVPATIISTYLNLPLTDVDSYTNGRFYTRSKKITIPVDRENISLRVLLVDDTINTGNAMRNVLKSLPNNSDTITKFAVYGSPKNKPEDIDFVCEICPLPRAFQWNLWKHNEAKNWGTDMDGVLCRDPTKKENDKGERLIKFYETTDPRFLFTKPIKYIITSRREKYRNITEKWLSEHGIQYQKLIMKPDHIKGGNASHSEYKAKMITDLGDMHLYIESDQEQAKYISELTSVPIWCTDNQTLYKRKT